MVLHPFFKIGRGTVTMAVAGSWNRLDETGKVNAPFQ